MSKNYSDMLALLEYVDRKKEKKVGKIFRRRRDDPEDITKQLVKYLESKEKFEKLIKSLEKKEEKKEDKRGLFPHWSTAKKTVFFALAGPPIGLMYAFIFITLVRQMAAIIVGVH